MKGGGEELVVALWTVVLRGEGLPFSFERLATDDDMVLSYNDY